MRSTGVAAEAACMVYLAISKLQVRIFVLACRDDEGLRGKLKKGKKGGGERTGKVRERRKIRIKGQC